ncbi:unnamed protein product [Lactuca virosa]|uniref:Uncharacterized protein n=1 Tax=Lactuca virosa TaxID=75947 RepID=A0AAU9NX83_9ASTR|nr:unnamed protein product [Lactuca virosa]
MIAATWVPYVEESLTDAIDWLIGGDHQVIQPIKYHDGIMFCYFTHLEADDVLHCWCLKQHHKVLEDGVLDPENPRQWC